MDDGIRQDTDNPSTDQTDSTQVNTGQAYRRLVLEQAIPNNIEDASRLILELRMRQVELEMENVELRRTNQEIEASLSRYFNLYDMAPVGYISLSERGVILETNLTAATLFGIERGELVGRLLSQFIAGDDLSIFDRHQRRLFATRQPQSCEMRMSRTDGVQFWVRLEAAVVRSADGTLLSRVIISDITARKQAELALQLQHDLGLKLNSTADLYQALGFIIDTVLQLDGIDCGGIYVADAASGALDLVVHRGLSPQFLELASYYPADSPNAQLARTGEVRFIDDADLRLLVDDLRHLEGLHAVAIIPVLNQGQLLAVLNLASHTFDAIPVSTRSTCETLALQIGSTLMRIRSRIALQESEVRYRLLLENQRDLVVKTDLEGRFLYVNPAYCELFGVTEVELLGKTYTPLVHPDDLPIVEKAVARLFEPPYECSYEERANTRYGWRWLNWTAKSMLDEQGKVTALIGSAQDITERKQAEEQVIQSLREKEILLRELNHRVKNNMHVISALLNLQASYTDNEEVKTMFADLHNRIQAMSLVHEKLYQAPDLSRIDLQDYVEDLAYLILTGNLRAADKISLVLDLEPIQVSMDIAIPFGMILNELMSNAMKHAFPDERSGEIRLRLQKDQDFIELGYADNGVGVPVGFDFRKQQSLGMQTIISLAERQLGGTVTFRSQPGVAWTIRFPNRL